MTIGIIGGIGGVCASVRHGSERWVRDVEVDERAALIRAATVRVMPNSFWDDREELRWRLKFGDMGCRKKTMRQRSVFFRRIEDFPIYRWTFGPMKV